MTLNIRGELSSLFLLGIGWKPYLGMNFQGLAGDLTKQPLLKVALAAIPLGLSMRFINVAMAFWWPCWAACRILVSGMVANRRR